MSELVFEPFFWAVPGSTHACLLLHGLGGGVYEMSLLARALHQRGLTVQAIAQPGHDQPAPVMPPSTWPQWLAHTTAAYQSLQADYAQVSLVGFSMGGALSLYLAGDPLTQTPPLHRLVLLCPFLRLRRPWFSPFAVEAYATHLQNLLPQVPSFHLPIRDRPMRQQAEAGVFYRTFSLAAVHSATELIAQAKTRIPKITTPTLILQARRDSVVEPRQAQILYDRLGSPQKSLHWLPQSDHQITLDLEREEVWQRVGDFLLA